MGTAWDDIYKNYEKGGEAWATLAEDIHPSFLPFIDRTFFPRKHALDIGCGTGKYLLFLYQHGFAVDGIDNSETALKMTHDNVSDAQLKLADMYTYPIPIDRYDLIVSVSTIHHGTKEQVAGVVQRIHGALIDGGHVFITIPEWNRAREQKMFSDHAILAPGTLAPLTGPEKGLAHSFYTKEEAQELFRLFHDIHIEIDSFSRWVVTASK